MYPPSCIRGRVALRPYGELPALFHSEVIWVYIKAAWLGCVRKMNRVSVLLIVLIGKLLYRPPAEQFETDE